MTTIDLKQLHETVETWARSAVESYDAKAVYLFGSLIHRGGAQFNQSSDVDLVVVMPTTADAVERVRWIKAFASGKGNRELQLMRILKRSATEPAASVVAVTELELSFDIHKDGHREFFTANTFLDLIAGHVKEGLPGAVAAAGCRFVAGGLAFAQKMRNEFYAVSANLTPRLVGYDGSEPLPKRIMRAAAMASRAAGKSSGPGAEHDVQEGLDLLTSELYGRRNDHAMYLALQDRLSVRRQARGRWEAVEAAACQRLVDQLGGRVVETYLDPEISGYRRDRPGLHRLLDDVRNGKIDIVVSEALDRLARDAEDVAWLGKKMRFARVEMHTMSEGHIDELKLAMASLMGAIFLKLLKDKTRRGLLAVIMSGRSAGGRSYGYRKVAQFDPNGEPINGLREIDDQEASVVRQIFRDFSGGQSAIQIATRLNQERVPGPRGGPWNQSTIRGGLS